MSLNATQFLKISFLYYDLVCRLAYMLRTCAFREAATPSKKKQTACADASSSSSNGRAISCTTALTKSFDGSDRLLLLSQLLGSLICLTCQQRDVLKRLSVCVRPIETSSHSSGADANCRSSGSAAVNWTQRTNNGIRSSGSSSNNMSASFEGADEIEFDWIRELRFYIERLAGEVVVKQGSAR